MKCDFTADSSLFTSVDLNLQGTNLNMSVYAPLANVAVKASGQFLGAIRGKTVNVDGAGGIHYDVALGGGSDGGGDGLPRSSIASVYDYYE